MIDQLYNSLHALFVDLAKLETDSIIFVVLLVISVIVIDGVLIAITRHKKQSGMTNQFKTIGVDGGVKVKAKEYISEELGLAGRPDAVIEEDGFIIPVERKPLQKKIHERQVAQLLVYMRLIEAIEGIRPPYGYLILGKNCKQIKIENTVEKQLWLSGIIDEIKAILDKSKQAIATPHRQKCPKCPVRSQCTKQRTYEIRNSPSKQIH